MHNDFDQLAARQTITWVLEKTINVLQYLIIPVGLYSFLYPFCSKIPYLMDGEIVNAPEGIVMCRAVFFSALIYGILLLLKYVIVWKYNEFKTLTRN